MTKIVILGLVYVCSPACIMGPCNIKLEIIRGIVLSINIASDVYGLKYLFGVEAKANS